MAKMTTMIGWRVKVNELSPHYYRKDDTNSGADAISLCEKFYASYNELTFPGIGMAFCGECQEIVDKKLRTQFPQSEGKLDLSILRHQDFYQAALKALDDGISRDEASAEEHSCYLIALTDAALALYLFFVEMEKKATNTS